MRDLLKRKARILRALVTSTADDKQAPPNSRDLPSADPKANAEVGWFEWIKNGMLGTADVLWRTFEGTAFWTSVSSTFKSLVLLCMCGLMRIVRIIVMDFKMDNLLSEQSLATSFIESETMRFRAFYTMMTDFVIFIIKIVSKMGVAWFAVLEAALKRFTGSSSSSSSPPSPQPPPAAATQSIFWTLLDMVKNAVGQVGTEIEPLIKFVREGVFGIVESFFDIVEFAVDSISNLIVNNVFIKNTVASVTAYLASPSKDVPWPLVGVASAALETVELASHLMCVLWGTMKCVMLEHAIRNIWDKSSAGESVVNTVVCTILATNSDASLIEKLRKAGVPLTFIGGEDCAETIGRDDDSFRAWVAKHTAMKVARHTWKGRDHARYVQAASLNIAKELFGKMQGDIRTKSEEMTKVRPAKFIATAAFNRHVAYAALSKETAVELDEAIKQAIVKHWTTRRIEAVISNPVAKAPEEQNAMIAAMGANRTDDEQITGDTSEPTLAPDSAAASAAESGEAAARAGIEKAAGAVWSDAERVNRMRPSQKRRDD